MDDLVVVESVPTAMEASLVMAFLRDAGIQTYDRPTNQAVGALDGWASSGAREIVVRAEDEARARETLAARRLS